jgi:hypothetical protein
MSTLNQYSEFLAEVAEYEADVHEVNREETYRLIELLEPMFGDHVYDLVLKNESIFAGLDLDDAVAAYHFICDPTSVLF